jgi:cell division protein DivIC
MFRGLKKFREKKWVAFVTNLYVVILSAFLIWMFFFDTNSFLIQSELQGQIDALEAEKEYLKEEIKKDRSILKKMSSNEAIEKLAREKYLLKKKNEDIFVIEFKDSITPAGNE